MGPVTMAAFVDELVKIAGVPKAKGLKRMVELLKGDRLDPLRKHVEARTGREKRHSGLLSGRLHWARNQPDRKPYVQEGRWVHPPSYLHETIRKGAPASRTAHRATMRAEKELLDEHGSVGMARAGAKGVAGLAAATSAVGGGLGLHKVLKKKSHEGAEHA